jgi:predicted transcriptional regulator
MAKEARLTKWKPKQWRPEYERAVAYSALGVSNIEIAKMLGFSKEYVSMILNLDESKKRMAEFLEKLKVNNDVNVTEVSERVVGKTLKRLESLLDNEEAFEKSPFAIIDRGLRLSEAIMKKGIDTLPGNSGGVHIHNHGEGSSTMIVTPETDDSLKAALRKAQNVRSLSSFNKSDAA